VLKWLRKANKTGSGYGAGFFGIADEVFAPMKYEAASASPNPAFVTDLKENRSSGAEFTGIRALRSANLLEIGC
jgi:hypothetical protein